ncbi:unnamed protein product [Arabis nemorensis]|uniref:Uncharacterized protein n=1 Tax=Arabis nemorensis TaxID=586526 RepID=A0A565CU69_9BRAS|nr:unnamed protein product [Arabis nemorensis]
MSNPPSVLTRFRFRDDSDRLLPRSPSHRKTRKSKLCPSPVNRFRIPTPQWRTSVLTSVPSPYLQITEEKKPN